MRCPASPTGRRPSSSLSWRLERAPPPCDNGRHVTVLLAEVEPRKRRQKILHNQRGPILAAALRSRTDAVVATLPFRLH
ncbi:MAG TPA: hypothetical protein VHY21_06270 [Pseudonocardiaceae bacterium]|nr:hypothetical protein [Pseudonocardiaceae bacterium]